MDRPNLIHLGMKIANTEKLICELERKFKRAIYALKQIRQEAIHNSDSVDAATKMGNITIEFLEKEEKNANIRNR